MLDAASSWARQQSKAGVPFFMGVFTVTAHAPYDVPSRFRRNDTSGAVRGGGGTVQEKYLATVRYTDRFLGRLHSRLEAAGLAETTLFIVAGDHGELFGEHGQVSVAAGCRAATRSARPAPQR